MAAYCTFGEPTARAVTKSRRLPALDFHPTAFFSPLLSSPLFSSPLFFQVDLAGSERVAKSEVKGDGLKEAAAINKSLSALGMVFGALGKKSPHIPYKNSALTHVRAVSRSTSPQWGPVRCRPPVCTYAPRGCIVCIRVDGPAKKNRGKYSPERCTVASFFFSGSRAV